MNLRDMPESEFNALPDRPRCLVTGALLSQEQFINTGRFASQVYKRLWKEHRGNLSAVQAVLSSTLLCPLTGLHYFDLKTWRTAATRKGFAEAQVRGAYQKHFQASTRCKFPGCAETVPFQHLHLGTCSVTHYNTGTRVRRGDYKLEDLKFVCALDGKRFSRQEDVGDYLRKMHHLSDAQMEEYYRQHVLTPETLAQGFCLQCGAPTTFQSIGQGYARFCFNTGCSVLWENSHTDRLIRAGAGIKAAHSAGDVVPSQLGYWLKKGLSDEEAALKLKERQTTNSVVAIAKREGCTLTEARAIRKGITDKWSAKTHTGQGWSHSSQKLFWKIWEGLGDRLPAEEVFFATFNKGQRQDDKNLEYRFETSKSYVKFDFFIISLKLVIEFDGEWYHTGAWRSKTHDTDRDASILAKDPEIYIHHIRERDWIKNPEAVTAACLEVINGRLANR